ncbi:MAG: peptide deformylase [Parasporobacterium sp.]|nr:peptide deformylase [Parasporobacterium sp.]
MALRTIRETGDPILRKISKPVKEITPRTKELIEDLIENMHAADGVGLAAVQVGILKRIAVVWVPAPEPEDGEETEETGADGEENLQPEPVNELTHSGGEEIVMVNPVWEAIGEELQTDNEGCLSVPGKYGQVTRPEHILLKAFDENMQPYEREAMGLLARAICHECDHMDGILYTDKVEGELHSAREEEEEYEE